MKRVKLIIEELRPKQWIKNLFVFPALIFSRHLGDFPYAERTLLAFFILCMASGASYIINDIIDLRSDRLHPRKCKRPLASGRLSVSFAAMSALFLIAGAVICAGFVNREFLGLILIFLILQVAYSVYFKHVMLLDVFFIAGLFSLRVIMGAVAIKVEISSWLVICTILLSLFLALSKRRAELILMADNAEEYKKVLKRYNIEVVDEWINIITSALLLSYLLYTLSPETVAKFHTRGLIFTSPFVLYGVLRYIYLIHNQGSEDSIENLVLKDKPLLLTLALWILSVVLVLYLGSRV
ncbi:MAG: decaprenyl-phosphate phosphoribosyltransferase [Candidatus Omnitrophica bacterium 4484_49]|nr:MAG: decaprenyl-phosphate phosphoribosyltransferase [Candidatus Omnitrophica bacterium 4484_49]